MKVIIKNKYLIFPVNSLSTPKELNFEMEGKLVYKLSINLDNFNPDFYAYIDVSRFIGQVLDISAVPEMEIKFCEAEEIDTENLYHEPMRPQIHFTAKKGWINDPNGLIYIDGTYHMFFQYNPAGMYWGKYKHWGHAVSQDLIHWHEEKTALFPDERGAMFSGSAILDEKNLLGKNEGDKKAAVLFYTTTEPFTQNISYSVDGFKTIENYSGNPIIPYIDGRNRDPKVIFCDELGCYIMILYIKEGNFYIFTSGDLVNWTFLQCIRLQGDRECPDIFPITDNKGNRKWVIMGAADKYLVGKFEDGKFLPEQQIMSLHYGACAYAGQIFSNLPEGRIVRIVWNRWKISAQGFNGQMGIPMELSLNRFNGVYYLEANPVKEIEALYKNAECYKNIVVSPQNDFDIKLEDASHLFKIKGDFSDCGVLNFSIFGRDIQLDFSKNEIKLGNCTAPISITRNGFDITVIVDRCSMEVFSDNGKTYMSCLTDYTYMDRNIPHFMVKSENEQSIRAVEVISLNSIWS